MKRILLFLVLSATALGSPQAATPETGALILVEPISNLTTTNAVGGYGISPAGLLDIKKSREELDLPEFGEKRTDSISVTLIGAVNQPGHYFLQPGASVADLVAKAKGFPRLATSKFVLRRGDLVFRIYVGIGHTVSPAVKDILPLFLLKDGDVVWVSEPTPY